METTGYQQPAQNFPVPQPRPSVGLGQALKNNFKYIFHFSGRASRSEFWWVFGTFVVSTIIVFATLMFLLASFTAPATEARSAARQQYMSGEITYAEYQTDLDSYSSADAAIFIFICFIGLWILILIACILAVFWRRLQDAGFHGAFTLLMFISLLIVPLVMAFFPSSPDGYKYDTAKDVGRP